MLHVAPLCPAGHLPRKGGDWLTAWPSPITNVTEGRDAQKLPISPLEGEIGRTEGGAKERKLWRFAFAKHL
jgi:hypothetical protein